MHPASEVPVPPLWSNPHLLLYHGTVDQRVQSILEGVDLRWARSGTDFGRGFYTTTSVAQAIEWAACLSLLNPGTSPAVIRFTVSRDDVASLDGLWFIRSDDEAQEFWGLVRYCRRGGKDHGRMVNGGWYDVVAGPVALLWRSRLKALAGGDQVSFHTARAARLLSTSHPEVMRW